MDVFFATSAKRDFRKIARKDQKLICAKLNAYRRSEGGNVTALKGMENVYRLRAGDWRLVFEVETPENTPPRMIITVVRHRRDVYR